MSRTPHYAIPAGLNVALAIAVLGTNATLLWTASHSASWVGLALAACAFSFSNNTVYSLLHEAVHRKFHSNTTVNEWAGRLLAASFPTGFSFHRMCHLGHHRRNRTEVERFDYYTPDDNRVLKFAQWYGILTGLYWLIPPLGCVLVLLVPRRLLLAMFDSGGSKQAEHIGAEAMLEGLADAPIGRMRLEILLSGTVQALAWLGLHLSFSGWAACYAAFAVNWSALQYADHAWSELDVHDGAWNLRVSPTVQYIFLNYHHHRAHHQHPEVPWIHLGNYVNLSEPRPSFVRIYLRMWRGPRPLSEAERT